MRHLTWGRPDKLYSKIDFKFYYRETGILKMMLNQRVFGLKLLFF